MDVNNVVERTELTPRHGSVPRLGAFPGHHVFRFIEAGRSMLQSPLKS